MGRVRETREQLAVGRDEDLGLEDVGLGAKELERLPRGAGKLGGRRAGRHRRQSSWRRGGVAPADGPGPVAADMPVAPMRWDASGRAVATHQLPPVSRARLRIVGPPLPSRFVCMGCPLPQFGMG